MADGIREIDPEDPLALQVVRRYAADLAQVLGFPAGSVVVDGQAQYRRPDGAFLVVEVGSGVAGCGALRSIVVPGGPAAEIKRMWLAPELRGRGYGRALLDRLHIIAGEMGHTQVLLDSRSELVPALRLYEAAGYRRVAAFNDNPDATVWMRRPLLGNRALLHEGTPT